MARGCEACQQGALCGGRSQTRPDGPWRGVVEFRSGCAEGRPNRQYELLRQTFSFDDIEGKVDEFELRCDWKRVADKVSSEKRGMCQRAGAGVRCSCLANKARS
ncbi:MAG: hypothetical protein QY320_14305 [Gammaproteobacteria bacterium]|nr:MAG: hypothetical protein QY320_14305 [Gammaproteobacteria bacterium]